MPAKKDSLTEKVENTVFQQTTEAEAINTTAIEAEDINTYEVYKHFVYIGPSLPSGMKSNVILQGSFEEIITYLGDSVEKYPQIKSLIVPIHKLGEQLKKVKTPGNIINKYFNDVVSIIRGNKEV